MKWFVSNDGNIVGPMDAADVRMGIDQGRITRGMHVRDEGGGVWMPIEQSPFAGLFASAVSTKARSSVWKDVGVYSLAAVLTLGGVVWCSRKDAPAVKTVSAAAPTPPPPPEPSILDRMLASKSLPEAIRVGKPWFEDTSGGDVPPGAAVFAAWAGRGLRWSELDAMPDSRRADVMKDPDGHRGQRLCTSGSVVEIRADRSLDPPVFHGGLMTSSYDMVRFIAVQSTSGIVANSVERFCGIVTGIQSYPNAGGGTTHAVFVVGMFDIATNH